MLQPESSFPTVAPTADDASLRKSARKKRGSVGRWVALGVLVVLIGLVASTVRGSAIVYSKYVDEIMAPGQVAAWTGRTVRVEGLVVPGSIENRPGTSEYRFRISRNNAVMAVTYRGIVPDTFRDCAGVTVRGELGAQAMFTADELIAKCPSRYEAATVVNGQCVMGMSPERGATGGATSAPLTAPTR
jgi:cytochrome c-type biogenesis protein CcmE